ncbi:MAG TPA: YibE/F family protein [Acidimicrobiales bacterium]|nr:YibE/F family protein [Acidimicrobiales bacterium]
MPHSHSHGHGHGDLDIPRELERTLRLAVVPVIVAVLLGLLILWPRGEGPDLSAVFGGQDVAKATVVSVEPDICHGSEPDSGDLCQFVRVRLREGPHKGEVVKLEAGSDTLPEIGVGDGLVVGSASDGHSRTYYFADYDRDIPLLVLVVLFVGAAVAFGRMGGVRALGALAAGLGVLVWFVIPAVLQGESPIAVSLVGAALIMLVVLYVTGGFNTQSTVAVLGTMASLALIALLAWIFVAATKLTGLADEDASFLSAAASNINLQGLLLGGIIIGSLGVLDDMTVTQVSTVWELRRANAEFDTLALYRAAERVGRDHIASTINTLVLAYAGASLPLLIYFTQAELPLRHILTGEVIAVEVVRTLVGSIGLIASVPITTLLASHVVTRAAGAVTAGQEI